MFKYTLPTLFLLLGSFGGGWTCEADTIIYLVRHTEKEAGDDPVLTAEGHQRALDLARMLRSANIGACFSTEFQRTRLTAAPTAKQAKIEAKVHQAGKEEELVKLILNDFADQSVLVVGHSTTVPNILRQLGSQATPRIEESDFDNLFVVRVGANGKASTLHLHYGAKDAE